VTNIPLTLRTAFHEKRLIPVVGAGVSMSIKDRNGSDIFPSWPGLLMRAAEKLRNEDKDKLATALLANLDIGRYKEAADIARQGLEGRTWGSFFRETFSVSRTEVDDSTLLLPRTVWKLADRVVSLNYDKTMRMAALFPDSILEIDNSAKSELADFVRGTLGEPAIWHLHGKFDNAASIVFTTESYDRLYLAKNPDYASALESFRALCRDSHLLFVGCSLDDADIISQISREYDLFEGNIGPHYVVTSTQHSAAIKTKLLGLPINVIAVSQFGQPLIHKLLEICGPLPPPATAASHVAALPEPLRKIDDVKVAVLLANPIGENCNYEAELRAITKMKCNLRFIPLTIEALNELEEVHYVIILTQTIKKKVVIEGPALSREVLSLEQIEENLAYRPSGTIIFTNCGAAELNGTFGSADLQHPTLLLPRMEPKELESLFFKVFRKRNLSDIASGMTFNGKDFNFLDLQGSNPERGERTPLPQAIDAKSTRNYVGRKTDLENIARSIFEIREKGQILTIKGAGGIGKTLTIKKLAVELSARHYFSQGIQFLDCESIADFKTFENKIAQCLDLENFSNIRESLARRLPQPNSLLILDNVETVLHLAEREQIIDLIGLVSDHTNIVATSREPLGVQYETIYELRAFTTDEAFALFCSELRREITTSEEKRVVREDILERILDNNPLAIKLITKNIPKGKNFTELRTELENDFFVTTTDVDPNIFDGIHDVNIERKRSLYASINFSYQHLSEPERNAFELLSLFPDGISQEHFKLISETVSGSKHNTTRTNKLRRRKANLITDHVIRALEDKSVIQIDNNMIKLQSIIGRFASHKLSARETNDLMECYRNAFSYNYSLLDALASNLANSRPMSRQIFNSYQANFIRCLDYAAEVAPTPVELLDYLDSLSMLFISISSPGTFIHALESRSEFLFDEQKLQLSFEITKITSHYYFGEFSGAFNKLKSLISFATLETLDLKDPVDRMIAINASDIYCIEGYAFESAKLHAKLGHMHTGYSQPLFQIGELNKKLAAKARKEFFTLEAMNAVGILSVKQIDAYLDNLYSKSHLERMQSTYVKSKMAPISKQVVRKLVVMNPYTAGLQSLMLAFADSDNERKIAYFEDALSNLEHVKYYYVEALYFYSKFLLEVGSQKEFEMKSHIALSMAKEFKFRYLEYLISSLTVPASRPYSPADYPFNDGSSFDMFVSALIKHV
jgi:hypothetical protein